MKTVSVLMLALVLSGCGALNPGSELPEVSRFRVHSGAEALGFDASSSLLASGGWDGEVALWRPGETEPLRKFNAHDGFVQGVAFAEDQLVTAGFDGRLKVWNRDGGLKADRDTGSPIDKMIVVGEHVVTAQHDGVLRYWRWPRLDPDGEIPLSDRPFASLAGHAASGRVASGGFDGRVYLIDQARAPRLLEAPPTDARSLTFSPDGRRLYGGGWFRMFGWDLASGELEVMPTAHWGVISSMQFAPREGAIASISRVNDSAVLFLDPGSGETLRDLRRHPVCGTTLALSPDGRYLANTGDDGLIRIFDLDNPRYH